MQKFENVDVLAALEQIMRQHRIKHSHTPPTMREKP